mmetsp:Transcript_104887/g.208485  ORF Transcript_104887/g.208485 Transcript_104887/m.208485 type:complete len:158 (+) Transcript_104887:121-594(+)
MVACGPTSSRGIRGVSLFRCSSCSRDIPEDAEVYMREDCGYCSPECRHRNTSRKQSWQREQVSEGRFFSQSSTTTSGTLRSSASIASCMTDLDDECEEASRGGRLGPLLRFGQRVIGALVKRMASEGSVVPENSSSTQLWSHEYGSSASLESDYYTD